MSEVQKGKLNFRLLLKIFLYRVEKLANYLCIFEINFPLSKKSVPGANAINMDALLEGKRYNIFVKHFSFLIL